MTRTKTKREITSTGGDGKAYELKSDGVTCHEGQRVTSFRGEAYWLTGGRAPQHEGSEGKVWVTKRNGSLDSEFYPSVFSLKWTRKPG
jgi:hypothetical protein